MEIGNFGNRELWKLVIVEIGKCKKQEIVKNWKGNRKLWKSGIMEISKLWNKTKMLASLLQVLPT